MRFAGVDVPKAVFLSYIFDYVIIIVLAIAFEILDAVEPFHQPFALENYTLQYPYAVHERIPIGAAIAVAIGGPLVVIAVYTLVVDGYFSRHAEPGLGGGRRRYTLRQRLWELNCGVLGLFLASATAFVITNVLKNATGKPRPDFIARCLPPLDAVDPKPFGLSNSTICTQTDASIMKDGFRSFPSGHSSSSFAGLFYLSLYLSGKLHLFDTRGFAWKTFVVAVPTLGAALIAVSRIEDARHHPFDVLSGSALGILCAVLSYRQYFPPLSQPWRKGRAYPIRTWGGPSERWIAARDNGAPDKAASGDLELQAGASGANDGGASRRRAPGPGGSTEYTGMLAPQPFPQRPREGDEAARPLGSGDGYYGDSDDDLDYERRPARPGMHGPLEGR